MTETFTFSKFCFVVFALFLFPSLNGQDTTWVQSFQYNSKTRDSLIQFPTGDHNQYEKILMYYNMRCKGALVSTGADRNKGCGEWDYSCNTSVIDSTSLDSLRSTHPDYIISGLTDDYFLYTTQPTYTFTDYNIQNVVVNSNTGITKIQAGNHQGNATVITKNHNTYKAWYIFKSSEMPSLASGNIAGISFKNKNSGKLSFLKIQIGHTALSELDAKAISGLSLNEVANRNITFNGSGTTDVYFHKGFTYDGTSNLVVALSFTGNEQDIQGLEILGTNISDNTCIGNISNDRNLELGTQGIGNLTVDGFKNIKNEITIAFWANGNSEILPANNSIFYAEDVNKYRQLNVHLPWSNSSIYWDCGADASGYDRIDKPAVATEFEGVWNHWAFTKNTTTGSMKIYLNGTLWHSATGKTKPITIDKFVLGGHLTNGNPYFGLLDDFTVWDKELSVNDIQSLMIKNPTELPSIQNNLAAYYDMNDEDPYILSDKSTFKGSCTFVNRLNKNIFRGNNIFKNISTLSSKPDISWLSGNANIQVTNAVQRDSVQNAPRKITPYSIIDKKLVAGSPLYYWAAGTFNVYDEDGNVVETVNYPEEDIIEIGELVYHNYSPSKFELLSFVTPYGIGLDFGKEGKTWVFDVTDYGPILKGKKRFLMDKGGERQEEMDIKFAFIKGIPTRPVLSIQQVWPVNSYNYTSILNNTSLESRKLFAEPTVKSMKVRTVATGHGQEGEFIARTHSINVNSGTTDFSWQLWKECGNNPIYPQGGTWIYDRAGWCPGAPSDLREYEIMSLVTPNAEFSLDYGINTATGDSRYIVNTQLVKYGNASFANDAAVDEIISPSDAVVNSRINPACANPTIVIKNNGTNELTSAIIQYGVEGGITNSFTWTGNLGFLKTKTIVLPDLDVAAFYGGKKFFANITQVNNTNDEYAPNNKLSTNIVPVKNLDGGIIISMKTNGAPSETKWTLKDSDGKIIKSSKTGLTSFAIYNDTIPNLSGCYQLQFTDSGQDGISWWANGDGDGYIRAKGVNGTWMTFQPDFGSEYTFNFVSGIPNATADENITEDIKIYPNPTSGEARIELNGFTGITAITLLSQAGMPISTERISNYADETLTTYIDLSEKPSGIYFLQITSKSISKTYKLIKI